MHHANSFIEAFLLGGLYRCIRYILRPLFDIVVVANECVGFVLQWSPMAVSSLESHSHTVHDGLQLLGQFSLFCLIVRSVAH